MLQHVVKAQILDLIFGRVDLLVRVLELRLNHKCRGVSETAGGGMVGAGVPALGLNERDVTVLRES